MVLEARAVSRATPIVASQFPSSRDALFVTCFLKPLTWASLNAVKQFYHNKTYLLRICKLIDNCDVAFYSNDWWNRPKTMPVIGMESMVTRARLRYTRDYLPPGISSLHSVEIPSMVDPQWIILYGKSKCIFHTVY